MLASFSWIETSPDTAELEVTFVGEIPLVDREALRKLGIDVDSFPAPLLPDNGSIAHED